MANTHRSSASDTPAVSRPSIAAASPPRPLASCHRVLLVGALAAAFSLGIARAVDVKALWEKHCTQCHGPDGKGLTKMGKKLSIRDLTDAKVQGEVSDEQMRRNIKDGVKDATGKIRMKPAENVSDAEISALVGYVRTLKSK